MNKPAVCIATIRPDSFKEWLVAWRDEFDREGVTVFTMVDAEDKGAIAQLPDLMGPVFDHKQVSAELGDKAWIIPKRTSACKSFAIYKAWKAGRDPIMVLDDDCLPDGNEWVQTHIRSLESKCDVHYLWNTLSNMPPRGTPKMPSIPIALSHGLWLENPDVDAIASMVKTDQRQAIYTKGAPPLGALFPMSGMNLAFRREIAPLMYFGLQGPDWGVDRFDDIWCGFLAKKVLDHCGYAVWSGTPYVRHIKASDPFVNIVKEAPGYKMNVELYEWVMRAGLSRQKTETAQIKSPLAYLASGLESWGKNGGREYWSNYGKAILEWLELFKPEEAFGI